MVLVQDALDQIVADVNIAQTSQSLEDWEKRISTSTGIQSEVHSEASASIATIDKFLLNHDKNPQY